MFVHNIDPTLLHLGPFEIRYYGLVYVIGFLLAYYFLNKKKKDLNLTKDDVESYILYLMISVIVGARLFEVLFWEPGYYFSNPIKILAIWEGGMAFHGSLVGVVLVTYFFCKRKKSSFAKLADIIVIPAVFALALGRIANFINGELWGTVTNVSWCVKFSAADGCRHPSQLYGALKRFIIFGVLLALNRKKHKPGFLFWIFIFLMGVGRFFLDFVREDLRFLGLSLGQYFSLAMVIISLIVLAKYYRTELN